MTRPLYHASDLTAGYGDSRVLHGLNFSIHHGTRLALIGPNGAGKTTLLRLLAGDLAPQTGTLDMEQKPLAQWPRRERARRIAFVPPSMECGASMMVGEFVALGRTPYASAWSRLTEQDFNAIDHALRVMDLHDHAQHDIHELSEGEKHRTMIALGLAQEPDILLLDEPTAHLDIRHAWHAMELIEELHQRLSMSIVLTSHDLNITAAFCSELFLMDEGKVVATGAPERVLDEDLLTDVYGYPVRVDIDPDTGTRRVFPIRRKPNG